MDRIGDPNRFESNGCKKFARQMLRTKNENKKITSFEDYVSDFDHGQNIDPKSILVKYVHRIRSMEQLPIYNHNPQAKRI